MKLGRNLAWLFVLAVALASITLHGASAQPSAVRPLQQAPFILDVGRPTLLNYNPHFPSVLGNQTPNVAVTIDSTHPIANVTLFYSILPFGSLPPRPFGSPNRNFTARQLFCCWSGNSTSGIYYTTMPHAENNTNVYGYAKVFDDQGNSNNTAYYWDTIIYNAYTPNPASSYLNLDFFVTDIDPKTLHMNMTIFADFNNPYNYENTILQPTGQGFTIFLDSQTGYYYSNSQRYYEVLGSGYSETFPFDNYTYTLSFPVPGYINEVSIGSTHGTFSPPQPNVIYGLGDFIGLNYVGSLQTQDVYAWNFETFVSFSPSHNVTQSSLLMVTIQINRNSELVGYPFLMPIFLMFAMLGMSVLLTDRDQLGNRLLVYFTVFAFSYTLQSAARSSTFFFFLPIYFGLSMMDRILIVIIPCTIVFAVFSIVGAVASTGRVSQGLFDWVGAMIAAFVLYVITVVPLTEYVSYPPKIVPFSLLFDTGWYGVFSFIALFSGLIGLVLKRRLTDPLFRIRLRRYIAND